MLAGAASKKVLPGKSACGRRAASKGKAVGGAGLNRFHVRAAAAPGGDERSGVMSRVRAVFTRTNAIAAHREGSSTLLDGAQTTVGGLAAGERKLADATRQRANEKVKSLKNKAEGVRPALDQLENVQAEFASIVDTANSLEDRVQENLDHIERLVGGGAAGAQQPVMATVPEQEADATAAPLRVAVTTVEDGVAVDQAGAFQRKGLRPTFADVRSLVTPPKDSALRNSWYPVHFLSRLEREDNEPQKFILFEEEWVLEYKGGEWGCRSAAEPDHTLRVGQRDGMLMVWPGDGEPAEELPGHFAAPEGYTVHAELIIEDVPCEHGLLMENLLDLAHAPFTHTGTFAKGWGVPNFVEFAAKKMRKPGDGWHDMASSLTFRGSQGSWKPYPIDMKFITPCMVDSHIGMAQAGAAGGGAQFEEGVTAAECEKHLHQLHVCLPSKSGRTRLLYRMSLDFAGWAKHVPGIELVWTEMANQVLGEDLRLVTGQQDRMQRGGRVWAHPVGYDKLGLVYRRWRNKADGSS